MPSWREGAPVPIAVRDADRLPYCVASDDAELDNGEQIAEIAVHKGVRLVTLLKGDLGKSDLERAIEASGLHGPTSRRSSSCRTCWSEPSRSAPRASSATASQTSRARWCTPPTSRRSPSPTPGRAGSTPAGYTVLPTVEEVTGRPARTFAQWEAENRAAFGG